MTDEGTERTKKILGDKGGNESKKFETTVYHANTRKKYKLPSLSPCSC